MTHQRLNTGVYSNNVQWKPIANKYRKGTMKSTLHSTQAALIAARRFKHYGLQAPKGVKERVKSPYSEYVIIYTLHCIFNNSVQYVLISPVSMSLSLRLARARWMYIRQIVLPNSKSFQRSTIGQSAFALILQR